MKKYIITSLLVLFWIVLPIVIYANTIEQLAIKYKKKEEKPTNWGMHKKRGQKYSHTALQSGTGSPTEQPENYKGKKKSHEISSIGHTDYHEYPSSNDFHEPSMSEEDDAELEQFLKEIFGEELE
jgi:hypothetical protein